MAISKITESREKITTECQRTEKRITEQEFLDK